MDSSDHTVKIRIFEITDLRGLFLWGQWVGKDLKKVFMTSVLLYMYDIYLSINDYPPALPWGICIFSRKKKKKKKGKYPGDGYFGID